MKHLVLLISLVAINCAIRVPNNWHDIYPTAVTVRTYKEFKPRRSSVGKQYYFKNPQRHADISNAGWKPAVANLSPVKSKQLKSMFYKKGLDGKYALNRINAVPYITYKKTANSPLFITPESISSKAYPKIQKKPSKIQKPNYTTFDHANNVPFNSHVKPSKQLPFDNFNHHHQSYEPNKNIINYFQAVKTDNFLPDNKLITYTSEESNDNTNSFTTYNTPRNNQIDSYSPNYFSHLQKNYRDDVNFEPEKEDKHYVKEEDPKFERNEVPQYPVSSHEIPKEIPTKPIYPGKGLWARPGLKHKPFVSQQTYEQLKDDGPTPEGYDTFVEGRQVFERNSDKFRSFPAQKELGKFINQHSIKDTNNDPPENLQKQEEESEEEVEEFVPTKLYAQVRASEDTEYLPMEEADDGVLREAINESKIHTIYTEEGYEDSAYDHAGHEKEAENDEGFEDLQREKQQKTEKKVPEAKYRLLPPSLHRTKFSYGGNLLTDEEIAEIKQKQLGLGDSDAEGTHFEDLPIGEVVEENEEIEEVSEESTEPPKLPKRNNNFISTKETKTMTTKENNDGDTETEISSKVKIILQPSNSTESKKYVKVFPKVYKTIKRKKQKNDNEASKEETDRNTNGIYIEEITTTTEYPTTEYQDLPEEIPITTVPTTAIPKPVHIPDEETLDDINKAFLKINRRYKRNIDDKKTKYPYYDDYKSMGLNVDSPLRYSQDMNQIPRKVGKKMVFYEEAEKRVPCPDIDTSLNPIPDRIQNVEKKVNEKNQINSNHNDNEDDNEVNKEEEEEEVEEVSGSEETVENRRKRDANEDSHSPRIAGLGNKIDCLKVRYFGENPLDSPIFDEITVGTVEPIFKPLKTVSKLNDEYGKKSHNQPKKDIQPVLINSTKHNAVTTISTINLITTPDYTIELKPKHIYDQIQLLEHLPNYRESINTNKSSSNLKELNVGSRQDKSIDDDNIAYESTDDHPKLPEAEELRRRRKIRRKRPLYQIFDVNKYLPTTPPPILQPITPYPQQTPIVNTKIPIPKATKLQIFDVNKFIPTTPSYIREIITSSTVLPKYKVLSEVFYKDDIKPNEQLNVFTDILNNIKDSSQIQNDTVDEPSEPVSVKLNSQNRFRHEDSKKQSPVHYRDSYLKAYGDQEIDQNYLSPATSATTTTTLRPTTYRRTRYKVKKAPERSESADRDFQQQLKLYVALQEAKKKEKEQQSSTVNDYGYTIPVREDENDYVEKTTKVVGLLPPGSVRYKTIYHPKRDNNQQISSPNQIKRKINKFFVVGLKPPPHQKQLTYLDFSNSNHVVRKPTLRRGRRSANRGSYASFSRNRGDSEEATGVEDDDDYMPHRSKNYYYDEKTGKIIYATTKKPDNEEYVDYEEITEELPAPPSTSKPLQDPVFATATPPPEGKGYVDFVLKLKQHQDYKYIPDPTTTEKGLEPSTERTTTQKPQSTTPPEFLNILAKVRQNSEYKLIDDKKQKTTPTPDEDISIEEDEDIPLENVQNSPGKHNLDSNEYFGIFDVTDFIPKIKNYLPKTSYDTSKYKTIERPSVQKSDEEEDEDEDEVATSSTTQAPIQTTTTQKSFVIITEEAPNRDTITKQSEERPVTVRRRRPTTTRTTSTTQKPTTKAPILRRRPTILRSTKTTTPHPTTETVRRTFRRRPTTQKIPIRELSNYEQNDTAKVIRRRSDHTTTTEPTITTRKTNKFIETFKKFHRNKKHQNAPEQSKKSEETVNKDVEIIADYDKTKRHGGNYRSIEDIEELMEEEIDEDDSKGNSNSNSLRISLLPSKEDAEENNEDSLEGRSLPTRKIVRKKFKGKPVTEPSVARLTDVVPKPEVFYTDPTLPRSINMLINEDNLSSTEIQDIISSTDSSETAENKQLNNKFNKTPVIIKDPSKRLYFYAPV